MDSCPRGNPLAGPEVTKEITVQGQAHAKGLLLNSGASLVGWFNWFVFVRILKVDHLFLLIPGFTNRKRRQM